MIRTTGRYSDHYSDRTSGGSGVAPCSQRVEGREQRVEGREKNYKDLGMASCVSNARDGCNAMPAEAKP